MNIFNFFQKREISTSEQPQVVQEQSSDTSQGANYEGNQVRIGDYSFGKALTVSAWFCAFERLANTMGQLVMEYQKKNNKAHGDNYARYDRGDGKHLNYLLQVRPNPLMSWPDFITRLTLARAWNGNGVAFIERGSNFEPVAFWPCERADLNVVTGKYEIRYNRPMPIEMSSVDPEDVIHWRNTYTKRNGLIGIGTISYAADALSISATNDKQALETSGKGGKMKLLLTEDKTNTQFGIRKLNKDQKNTQKDSLQKALNEGDDVLLMSGLMDAKVISQDASQMQLLESRKFDVPTISRFTGVPPVLLMDYTNNTYKAPEQAMQDFLLRTIAPMAHSLECEFNAKLIGVAGWQVFRFKFNDEMLMRLDPMGRANIAKTLLECGIMCPNELRLDYDLPAIEGGDEHYISTNLQSLKNPVVSQQPQQPQPQQPQENEGEDE